MVTTRFACGGFDARGGTFGRFPGLAPGRFAHRVEFLRKGSEKLPFAAQSG